MLFRGLEIHDNVKKDHDREWIHLCMSFLKAFVTDRGLELLSNVHDKMEYINKVVSSLFEAVKNLNDGIDFE